MGYLGLGFRAKKDYELDGLSDEELIAYVVAARHAGDNAAAKLGLGMFAYRNFELLAGRARTQPHVSRSDAEDIAGQVIEAAFKAAFRGEFYGEAMAFLSRILRNKVADFHRKWNRTEQLPEDQDSEERKRPDAAVSPDDTGLVGLLDVIERRYARMSVEHRMVVDLYVFDGHDAVTTATQVNGAFPDLETPMSDENVHQIASRYRRDLRSDLQQGP